MNVMNFLSVFEEAAAKLNVRLVGPTRIQTRSGKAVVADACFPGFGSAKGTLVFPLTEHLLPEAEELMAEGYAVSLVDVPERHMPYSAKELSKMLRDWGWCGSEEEKPTWLE
jgi:hypothetical protein